MLAVVIGTVVGMAGCESGEKNGSAVISKSGGYDAGAAAITRETQQKSGIERTAEVTMRGKPVTLEGVSPKVGESTPPFAAVTNDMGTWKFRAGGGKVWILSSVPSLDTGVCSRETKRFNDEVEKLR